MAALPSTTYSGPGIAATATAVSASDTVTQSQLGSRGALLFVLNAGASPDTVAISDGGATPAGNAGSSSGGSVTNATQKMFFVSPYAANLSTGLVTITHSFTTSVTCYLIPLG